MAAVILNLSSGAGTPLDSGKRTAGIIPCIPTTNVAEKSALIDTIAKPQKRSRLHICRSDTLPLPIESPSKLVSPKAELSAVLKKVVGEYSFDELEAYITKRGLCRNLPSIFPDVDIDTIVNSETNQVYWFVTTDAFSGETCLTILMKVYSMNTNIKHIVVVLCICGPSHKPHFHFAVKYIDQTKMAIRYMKGFCDRLIAKHVSIEKSKKEHTLRIKAMLTTPLDVAHWGCSPDDLRSFGYTTPISTLVCQSCNTSTRPKVEEVRVSILSLTDALPDLGDMPKFFVRKMTAIKQDSKPNKQLRPHQGMGTAMARNILGSIK